MASHCETIVSYFFFHTKNGFFEKKKGLGIIVHIVVLGLLNFYKSKFNTFSSIKFLKKQQKHASFSIINFFPLSFPYIVFKLATHVSRYLKAFALKFH